MQDAVESVPDPKLFFVGLDMDVRCFLTDGIHKNFVNKPDNGRVGFGILQAVRGIRLSREGVKVAVLIQIRQFRTDTAQDVPDDFAENVGIDQNGFNAKPALEFKGVKTANVSRIRNR